MSAGLSVEREFRYQSTTPLQFGVGALARLGKEAAKLKMRHAFLVTDPGLRDTEMVAAAQARLRQAGLEVTVFGDVVPDPDVASISHSAEAFRSSGADGFVALGGGSAMDTAKATAVLAAGGGDSIAPYFVPGATKPTPVIAPLVCLPTTAGTGAEVTPIAVVTDPEQGIKRTLFHAHIAPALALVDPALTVSLPPKLTASTGFDALSHAAEALTSKTANPIADALAVAALELIGRHLARAVEDGADMEARAGMSLAAVMAGQAFANALVHLGHAVGHAVGVAYHMPHGIACAVALPAALDYIRPAAQSRLARVARALDPTCAGTSDAEAAAMAGPIIADLYRRVGLPGLTEAVGVGEADLPHLVEITLRETDLIRRSPMQPSAEDWTNIYRRSL